MLSLIKSHDSANKDGGGERKREGGKPGGGVAVVPGVSGTICLAKNLPADSPHYTRTHTHKGPFHVRCGESLFLSHTAIINSGLFLPLQSPLLVLEDSKSASFQSTFIKSPPNPALSDAVYGQTLANGMAFVLGGWETPQIGVE